MLTKTARLAAGAALAVFLWAQSGAAQPESAQSILRIGMVAQPPAGNLVDGAMLIEQAFSDATGLPTQIFVARDYAALIDAQARGHIDYGIFSATAYATARRVCGCVEAIAAPIGTDGSTGMRAVLIHRRDATGTGPIAVVSGDATGWLASAEPGPGPETAGRMVAVATASDAENMLVSREADGMIGWVPVRPGTTPEGGTLSRLVEAGIPAEELLVHWQSEPLRYGPHAVRADMPAETRAALVRFLAGLHDTQPDVLQHLEPMRQGGFVRVSDADYATARAMVDRVADGEAR